MIKQIEVTILPDGRLDTENASKYLGLTVRTLAQLRCKAKGPKYVKAGKVFYYKADLDLWLLSGETKV